MKSVDANGESIKQEGNASFQVLTELRNPISLLALALALFQLYTASFGLFTAMYQRGIHITLVLALVFLMYRTNLRKWQFVDPVLTILSLLVGCYLLTVTSPSKMHMKALLGPSATDLAVGVVFVALVLEAARRTCGLPLVMVSILALLYGYAGGWLPSIFGHKGYPLDQLIEQTVFTHEGIFGVPLAVSSTLISIFVLFGAFLAESGAGEFFTKAALALTGRTKSGPALSSVVSSALTGMVSGSSVANVVTTGTFTIPLMKKTGYKPEFAGAVEAVASTGGQIMPPIMGAAAFIIAEILNIGYTQVAVAAAIPAVLYFVSVGFMVHLEALRLGLRAVSKSELPKLGSVIKEGFNHILPLIALIYFLASYYTPTRASLYSLVILVATSYLSRKSRMTPARLVSALVSGSKSILSVAAACGAAGVVIGIVTITGLGLRMSNLIITLSGGSLLLALILTMLTCVVLGMAVPTSAAYIITASLGAPALLRLGVPPLAAHLFVFYFACVSDITPPVALSAYAGAGLARSDPMKTALLASRLGIAAYVVPFMFVYGPALILVGKPGEVFLAIVTSLAGIFFLASAAEGWLFGPLSWASRVAFLFSSLMLIKPGASTDLIGVIVSGLVLAMEYRRHARLRQTLASAKSHL